MAKKPVTKKPTPAKKTRPAPAASKAKKPSAAKGTAKTSSTATAEPEHIEPATPAVAAQRLHAFTCKVGQSDQGDRIVEVAYPDDLRGEVLAVFFQPARAADDIPDEWTEQHAVQLLRFSRESNGSATVRIHRIDHGWNGSGWGGNLLLHALVATR
ncbi:MAG: hypothetical protein KF708_23260 [Pirellulales bacterium]|nr:hypothetical protein [Pirellulales bacterium]